MPAESGPAHPPHTVLVVEDSKDSRDALALLLEVEGFQVAKAASATDALLMIEGAEGLRPCLVLLDLVLPEMRGLDFARYLRAHPDLSAIPVAALTGHEGQRREAEQAGLFTAALLKPTDIPTLLALVGNHCPRGGECDDEENTARSSQRGTK
jgi:CheY-like chemotaxis protein